MKLAFTSLLLSTFIIQAVSASVISVNFVHSTYTSQIVNSSTPAGINKQSHWNNSDGNSSGTLTHLTDSTGKKTQSTLTWLAPNTWGDASAAEASKKANGNAQLRRGYLDDAGVSPSLAVTNIPYSYYHVILYFSTGSDGGKFLPVKINGAEYKTHGEKSTFTTAADWGAHNSVMAKNLTGKLSITTLPRSGDKRASIAAIQIIKANDPTASTLIGVAGLSLNLQKTTK